MSINLLKKLHYKYSYCYFINKQSLEIGSLIQINLLKGKYKSNFFGLIIKKRNKRNKLSITLRNVLKKYAIEQDFNLNSKTILSIYLLRNRLDKYSNRYNLFYSRSISKIHSTIKI